MLTSLPCFGSNFPAAVFPARFAQVPANQTALFTPLTPDTADQYLASCSAAAKRYLKWQDASIAVEPHRVRVTESTESASFRGEKQKPRLQSMAAKAKAAASAASGGGRNSNNNNNNNNNNNMMTRTRAGSFLTQNMQKSDLLHAGFVWCLKRFFPQVKFITTKLQAVDPDISASVLSSCSNNNSGSRRQREDDDDNNTIEQDQVEAAAVDNSHDHEQNSSKTTNNKNIATQWRGDSDEMNVVLRGTGGAIFIVEIDFSAENVLDMPWPLALQELFGAALNVTQQEQAKQQKQEQQQQQPPKKAATGITSLHANLHHRPAAAAPPPPPQAAPLSFEQLQREFFADNDDDDRSAQQQQPPAAAAAAAAAIIPALPAPTAPVGFKPSRALAAVLRRAQK